MYSVAGRPKPKTTQGFLKPSLQMQRGGSESTAREKGFITPGWTAYFCTSKRRWLLWAPDGTYFFSLGSARGYEEKLQKGEAVL